MTQPLPSTEEMRTGKEEEREEDFTLCIALQFIKISVATFSLNRQIYFIGNDMESQRG